jgi:hypothetical protein
LLSPCATPLNVRRATISSVERRGLWGFFMVRRVQPQRSGFNLLHFQGAAMEAKNKRGADPIKTLAIRARAITQVIAKTRVKPDKSTST